MKVLSRDAILKAQDLGFEDVAVPEWEEGAVVRVAEISAKARLAFTEVVKKEENQDQVFIALALTQFIVDEEGNRVFTDDDAPLLADKSIIALRRIWDVARRLNGLEGAVGSEVKN